MSRISIPLETRIDTRGFTLMELLVVIAVIGIMSSVIMLALGDARDRGRQAAAMVTAKSMQTLANLCMNEPAATICLPGQSGGACTASPISDSINGGGGPLCSGYDGTYAALPSGWVWCDSNSATGACFNSLWTPSGRASIAGSSYTLYARRSSDGATIRCRELLCEVLP